MKSKNQDDRLADKQEEKQIGRPTGRTDIQINLYKQKNIYTRQDSRGRLDRSGNAKNTRNSKMFWMDQLTNGPTNQPTRQRTKNDNKNKTKESRDDRQTNKKKSHFQKFLKQNKMMITLVLQNLEMEML